MTSADQKQAVRRVAAGSALALSAALTLVGGSAAAAPVTPAPPRAHTGSAPACGAAAHPVRRAAATTGPADGRAQAPAGNAAQQISYRMPAQAPIGLWTTSAVTLRAPVSKGTVHLDVTTTGFSTDSLALQRYVPSSRSWVDLAVRSDGGGLPAHADFSFPVTAAASAAHPYTVALRLQDLDRPGTLKVAASVADGRGHTYRAPVRTAAATRPAVSVAGWRRGATLLRGGAPTAFTVTVHNTTDRAYPGLTGVFNAYGQNRNVLRPADLVLQQYRAGHGWKRIALTPDGCDPGMFAVLAEPAEGPLAPGATAVYRLRLAVAAGAPGDVTHADAGLSVGTGDMASFFSQDLSFAIGNRR
ncbi:hypothetical protein [Peterkaempfera griseoplana]|uniref:hypothetical protein n=1 Tax=Peterkaempfera griseoplana TaxID=66896 RepID=UPI0006E41941|nr:hypothetical protein [Peterkaempfera griseoplana]